MVATAATANFGASALFAGFTVREVAKKASTYRTFWLLVNHSYENNQRFIYSTNIELRYTAGLFNDFIKSFGAGWLDFATGMRIKGIHNLTVISGSAQYIGLKMLS